MVWPKYCSFDCSPKKWSKSIDGNQKKLFMIIVTVLLLLLELFFAKCKLHQQHLFIEVDFQVNKNKMKWLKMKRTLKYTINQSQKYHDWILDTFLQVAKRGTWHGMTISHPTWSTAPNQWSLLFQNFYSQFLATYFLV